MYINIFIFRGKRITLLYGRCDQDIDQLHSSKKVLDVRHKKIINKDAFGYQHRSVTIIFILYKTLSTFNYKFYCIEHFSKVSMIAYTDGSLRVVVMSANLCEDDWTKFNQG